MSILVLASPALAQELQYHEVSADADVSIESGTNTSTAALQYTLTPEGIDRQDEVIPSLRRFVRHPSSAFVRIFRKGSVSIESRTGVALGGVLHLFDGAFYAGGDIGLQRNDVLFDDFMGGEGHYDILPFHLELGGRPVPLLSLGAYYFGDHYILVTGVVGDGFLYNDPIDVDGLGWDRVISGASLKTAMNASDARYAYSAVAVAR